MQTKKMSLANMQGKLSRAEMKNIMAGSDLACAKRDEKCSLTKKCCQGLDCIGDCGSTGCSTCG